MQTISIIPSTEINTTKWDACVANNSNGLIYAYSYYLNHLVDHWHAVVVNDYELIFPIPHKKKLGIQYSYMPAFTQQLGFIGNTELINPTVVNAIQSFVQYASPYLNFSNQQFAVEHGCNEQKNYILNLHQPYEGLRQHYQKTMDYSLSKAAKFNLQYNQSNNFEHAVEAYYDYNKNNMRHVTKTNYEQLKKLMHFLQDKQQLLVRTITNEQEEILSEVVLMKDNKRYYNIINVTTALGRKQEANYFLYDNLLKELSNKPMLFDFEGSDLTGVQKFYEKFGAVNQPYFHWHYNLLPKPLQWLKK